jgi:hypothetical protein
VAFHSRRNLARLGLGYEEIALLEVLRDWPEHVEVDWTDLERAVGRLRDDGRVGLDRVRKAAAEEHVPALRERVTELVSHLGAHAPTSPTLR